MSAKCLRKILYKLGVLRDLSLALSTPSGTAVKIQIRFGGTHPSLALESQRECRTQSNAKECGLLVQYNPSDVSQKSGAF